MIIGSKKFGRQNSAYRHQNEGRFGNEAPFALFCKAHKNVPVGNHLIHSVLPAALPRFVQPVLKLKQPPEGIRAEAATPGGYLARAALWHAHASNSPPQRRRRR